MLRSLGYLVLGQTKIQQQLLRALFSCVGKFGVEILGDAGQTKWLTWNYVTNLRQLLHPYQPKQHRPDLQDVKWAG